MVKKDMATPMYSLDITIGNGLELDNKSYERMEVIFHCRAVNRWSNKIISPFSGEGVFLHATAEDASRRASVADFFVCNRNSDGISIIAEPSADTRSDLVLELYPVSTQLYCYEGGRLTVGKAISFEEANSLLQDDKYGFVMKSRLRWIGYATVAQAKATKDKKPFATSNTNTKLDETEF